MCGLAGFLRFDALEDDRAGRRAILEKMGRLLERRGPDDQQIHDDGGLSFVFRRLSIIDVEGGTQPIWNRDETVFVAVNGEIYNHRELRSLLPSDLEFRTESDSEIVLHLYEQLGEAALDHLIGMYAIVLWDSRERRLLLARDRMGIKPLYYAAVDGTLIFGSELKALLAHPDCPRQLNWADLVEYGPQQKPEVSTYVQGIHHLPGGHRLSVAPAESVRVRRYWQIDDHFGSASDLSAEQAVDRYDELLADSVRMRLMSDVPLGIFLSGGIDSALITAMAARHQIELDCFTVVERTTYLAGDVEQARAVSAETDMRLHPVLYDVDALRDGFGLAAFEQQIALMESPRFDPEWLFKLKLHQFAKDTNPDLKVILLGQGADEFAGGYSHRMDVNWTSWQDYLDGEIRPELARLSRFDASPPERLWSALSGDLGANGISDYQRKMKRLTYQLQHFNLWHEDRTSSNQSIESRVPFLDHRLVELLAGLDPALHAELFWDKAIVRKVSARWLPGYPQDKRKVAFFVTDDLSSIHEFMRALVLQVYPDFRDKYAGNDLPFDLERLDAGHRAVQDRAADSVQQAWQMVEAMAVTVFTAFCQDPEAFLQPRSEDRLTGVSRVAEEQWPALDDRFRQQPDQAPQRQWTLESRVRLSPGGEILTPLTEDEDLHVVILRRGDHIHATMQFPEAAYWGVMMLEKMGRSQEAISVGEWAQLTGMPPPDVVQMLDGMVSAGFVEIAA